MMGKRRWWKKKWIGKNFRLFLWRALNGIWKRCLSAVDLAIHILGHSYKMYEWSRCLPEILRGTNQTHIQWLILWCGETTSNIVNTRNAACAPSMVLSYLQICDNCIRPYLRVNRKREGESTGTLNVRLGCDKNVPAPLTCCTALYSGRSSTTIIRLGFILWIICSFFINI